MSLGAYERTLTGAWDGELLFVRGFHDHPAFIQAVVNLLSESLAVGVPERLFFTAHSLPTRIVAEGDPYPDRLLESCRLVEGQLELPPWEFAFQSASTTGEPWLGPDVLVAVERSAARNVLVCPIGFVADHLEILYDLDIEAQHFARKREVRLRRTASLNTRPDFIEALAAVVSDAIVSPARRAERV
jgi:ferrochelatase